MLGSIAPISIETQAATDNAKLLIKPSHSPRRKSHLNQLDCSLFLFRRRCIDTFKRTLNHRLENNVSRTHQQSTKTIQRSAINLSGETTGCKNIVWQENPFKEALPQKHDIPINLDRAPIDKTALVQGQINKA